MKKLDVPYFQQTEENDCMLACSKMIADYHGVPMAYDEALKAASYYENGLSMTQMGMLFLKKGMKAEIISLNPYLFNRHDIGKSNDELFEKIKALTFKKEEHIRLRDEYLEFITAGGKLSAQIPAKEIICQSIDENTPCLILTTTRVIHGHSSGYNFHGNVVYGYDEKHFYIHDPEKEEQYGGGSHMTSQDLVLFAMHSSNYADMDNGSILKVTR